MKNIFSILIALIASCTISLGQSIPNYLPSNGLVGWWPFNGNANDESGNGNNGMVNGATLDLDRFGNANKAYSFDGIDDNCNLNTALSNNFSISFWAQIDSFKVYDGISSELLSTFNQNFTSTGFVFRTDAIPNKIVSGFWNNNGDQVVTKNDITQSEWYNYIVTYESDLLKLYFNGFLCDSITGTFVQNNQNVFLASRQIYEANNPGLFADCLLDDIGIWNRALNQQEITDLYNANICYQTITVTDTLIINTGIVSYNPVNYNNTIKIFPNPANNHITIDYGNYSTLNGYQLIIENSLGQQLFQTNITQQTDYLSLNNWGGNGLYFVHIVDPQGNTIDIRKIVLQ
jgi:hypothetical protein